MGTNPIKTCTKPVQSRNRRPNQSRTSVDHHRPMSTQNLTGNSFLIVLECFRTAKTLKNQKYNVCNVINPVDRYLSRQSQIYVDHCSEIGRLTADNKIELTHPLPLAPLLLLSILALHRTLLPLLTLSVSSSSSKGSPLFDWFGCWFWSHKFRTSFVP